MKMQFLVFLFFGTGLYAQSDMDDRASIIRPIQMMFDGMRAGDSSIIAPLFTTEARLSSIVENDAGKVTKRSSAIRSFLNAVGSPHDEVWDEKIWSYDVRMDGPMAYVWTEYSFYRGTSFSHCGVNMFELMKTNGSWKISGITDTRRKTGCREDNIILINELLDSWHLAAASADEDIFFDMMTADGVYIGTDPTERWTRDELRTWSKAFFERDSAWSFTPESRNVEIDEGGQLAWFDELLSTWMGTCRGSGILILKDGKWKITQYHLSIAVPNDSVDAYLKLINQNSKE